MEGDKKSAPLTETEQAARKTTVGEVRKRFPHFCEERTVPDDRECIARFDEDGKILWAMDVFLELDGSYYFPYSAATPEYEAQVQQLIQRQADRLNGIAIQEFRIDETACEK